MRSGASATSRCCPSSPELETSARRTPLFLKISIACFGGTRSHASWLEWMCASKSGRACGRAGPDGRHARRVEGSGASIKVGQKAFGGMKDAAAEVWATDCPLAALQFQQHAGKKPLHPMSILARAYRADGFATRVEPRAEGAVAPAPSGSARAGGESEEKEK